MAVRGDSEPRIDPRCSFCDKQERWVETSLAKDSPGLRAGSEWRRRGRYVPVTGRPSAGRCGEGQALGQRRRHWSSLFPSTTLLLPTGLGLLLLHWRFPPTRLRRTSNLP